MPFPKGHKPWNKGIKSWVKPWLGKKHSEETKRKISIYVKKHPIRYWKGKKLPKQTEAAKVKALLGKKLTAEQRLRKCKSMPRGEKHYLWRGGVSNEAHNIRASIQIRLWREAVFARDNYICQKTGIRGEKIQAHHILNFSQYPELRFAIDNGITLSEKAHKEFHKKYGNKNNTREQLIEFLNN